MIEDVIGGVVDEVKGAVEKEVAYVEVIIVVFGGDGCRDGCRDRCRDGLGHGLGLRLRLGLVLSDGLSDGLGDGCRDGRFRDEVGLSDNSLLLRTRLADLLDGNLGDESGGLRLRDRVRSGQGSKLIDEVIVLGLLGARLTLLLRSIGVNGLLGARSLWLGRKIGLAPISNSLTQRLLGILSVLEPGLIEGLLVIDRGEDTKALQKLTRSGLIEDTGILDGRDKEESKLHKLIELGGKIGLLLLDGCDRDVGKSSSGHDGNRQKSLWFKVVW
jgi:hypothetical protein